MAATHLEVFLFIRECCEGDTEFDNPGRAEGQKQPNLIDTGHWWSRSGSNRRPPECHSGALPTELRPHGVDECMKGLGWCQRCGKTSGSGKVDLVV